MKLRLVQLDWCSLHVNLLVSFGVQGLSAAPQTGSHMVATAVI